MSEYSEKHSVARLIGSPPGYVGYEEGGQLTEAVRQHPYSVILFDEIEKAHNEIFNVLLQLLDDGRLTDSKGRTVDFKNTVVIMTSNLASEEIYQLQGKPQAQKAAVDRAVSEQFRPEFINRLDEVIVFQPLSADNIKQIVALQLIEVEKRLAQKQITLNIDHDVISYLAKSGFDQIFGARPLKRLIQNVILDKLALMIIENEVKEKDQVKISYQDKKLKFVVLGKN